MARPHNNKRCENFLRLHQIQLNHLIKTGAWKHQHMAALNLHQGVMCSGERLHFNPSAQTFTGCVCRCCRDILFFLHYLSDKSAEWKCWGAQDETGNECTQWEQECYLRRRNSCETVAHLNLKLLLCTWCFSHKGFHQTTCFHRLDWAAQHTVRQQLKVWVPLTEEGPLNRFIV